MENHKKYNIYLPKERINQSLKRSAIHFPVNFFEPGDSPINNKMLSLKYQFKIKENEMWRYAIIFIDMSKYCN